MTKVALDHRYNGQYKGHCHRKASYNNQQKTELKGLSDAPESQSVKGLPQCTITVYLLDCLVSTYHLL